MQNKQLNRNNILMSLGLTGITIGAIMVVASLVTKQYRTKTIIHQNDVKIIDNTPVKIEAEAVDKKVSSTGIGPSVNQTITPTNTIKNIKALKLPASRTINLFGVISSNAHSAAAAIRSMNASSNEPIYLILYSPGGSVADGAALISVMQASNAPVYTVCYTFCASMAAMIHQYGVKRYMTDRSILMFHPASFGTDGEVDKMFSQISMIKRYTNKIEMEVATRMKLTFDQYKRLTANEYWLDSEDGLKANAVDNIVYLIPTSSFFQYRDSLETEDKKSNSNKISSLKWIY